MRYPVGFSLLLAGLLGASRPAAAQEPQAASAAQALFDQASEEMEKKSFVAACPRLEEATKLVPAALGARMALAECYEGRGKLASAWSQYAMVEGLATRANQPERAEAAGAKASELKPRLATLTIDLASGLDAVRGLSITRDGLEVGAGQWGVVFPADMGSHLIVATAPGRKAWKRTIEILADGAKATVKIPMLIVDSTTGDGAEVVKSEVVRAWQRPLGIGAMAAGVLGIGAGALFGELAIARNKESDQGPCDAHNQCSNAGLALRSTALGFGTGSTAAFIAGGIFAAGGLVLTITAPRVKHGEAPKAGVPSLAAIGATLGGVKLEGTW
jgi:hypothetical protein